MAEEKKEQAPAVQPTQQPEPAGQAGQPGSAPAPAPPPSVVPAESSAVPASAESPVAKPVDFGGVSYEEVRKGQSPILIKNPDQAMWNDRFTSQYMLVNMTNGRWKPLRPLFIPE